MKKGERVLLKRMMFLAVVLMLFFLITGCSKNAKHKVLTFFFTGVPPLEGEDDGLTKAGDAAVDKKKVKKKRKLKNLAFVHGPRASGECFQCHQSMKSEGYGGRRGKKTKSGSIPLLHETMPGKVSRSISELCVECHVSKSMQSAVERKLWLHGPLATGVCGTCHDHHSSRYNYMLLQENSIRLCTQCHTEEFLGDTEEHRKNEECISCHNPHLGRNRLLLKKDYVEVF